MRATRTIAERDQPNGRSAFLTAYQSMVSQRPYRSSNGLKRSTPIILATRYQRKFPSIAPAVPEMMMPVRLISPRTASRSEEHTSELQSLMSISYAVFCLKKNTNPNTNQHHPNPTPPQHPQP